MPPKKRDSEGGDHTQVKRRKKKNGNVDDSDDSDVGPDGAAPNNDEYDENKGDGFDITLDGSLLSGQVLICGGTNWDLIGRREVPKGTKNVGGPNLYSPHRLACLDGVSIRSVISGCIACHSLLITTEGQVYIFGRNDKGQLGLGDTQRRDKPTLLAAMSKYNVVDAACGKNHTLLLTEKGLVFACGDNKMGQLGLGHQSPSVPSPTRIRFSSAPVRKVACGGEFSMIADIHGNLYSFGCPEYGQLGHNTDGKYFVTCNKLSFRCELVPRKIQLYIDKTAKEGIISPVMDVDIRNIACGANHSIAMDSKKRIFTWGFGGYGRLGHNEQKDEMVPRQLKFFEGTRGGSMINCGSSFCMIVSESGVLYLCGITKMSGDAAMYPKLVQDLSGWRIRDMACCNKSIVVLADDSVVSWGSSPTYGELGYGDTKQKSSTLPLEVKPLIGIHVHAVSCGFAHTLLIAREDSEEDKNKLEKLSLFDP